MGDTGVSKIMLIATFLPLSPVFFALFAIYSLVYTLGRDNTPEIDGEKTLQVIIARPTPKPMDIKIAPVFGAIEKPLSIPESRLDALNKMKESDYSASARTEYTAEDVGLIAQTIAGECYNDKPEDKRKVAEVIVNRLSDGRFGKTIKEIVSSARQFHGYWKQSRKVNEADMQIAELVLSNWYANDCKALSEYLYFSSGGNRENVFRAEY
jgi:hypothetical protein